MYVMCGLLVVGFICDLLVRPVDERHYYRASKSGGERPSSGSRPPTSGAGGGFPPFTPPRPAH
jgi:hypothetical protein